MKKRIILIVTLIFVIFLTINVRADSYSYYLEREGDTWSYLNIPRSVKSGDVITVNAVINTAVNYEKWLQLREGQFYIEWDKNVFELVPYLNDNLFMTPTFYSVDNSTLETINVTGQYGDGSGFIRFDFKTDYDYLEYGKNKLVELKFRVRDNVPDGLYTIKQTGDYIKLLDGSDDSYCDDWDSCEWIDTYLDSTLTFQVGDLPVASSHSKNDIENSSYIIGDHLFTRNINDEYDGVLTTEYIMLASKSIESNKKEDMIIYAKNARGNWVNAINNQPLNAPDYFDVSYIDMKINYKNSGIYINNDTAIEYVELDDTSASVRIENNDVLVESIATISNNVASFTAGGKNYSINVGKDSISLTTNDEYLTNGSFNKKYSYTIFDLYEEGLYLGERKYFSSKYNGKYVLENKEIYTYQTGEGNVKVIMKSGSNTDFDWYMFSGDNDNEISYSNYKITFGDNKITVQDYADDSIATYTKERSISLEEAIKLEVRSSRLFAVKYVTDIDNGYTRKDFYESGSLIYNPGDQLPSLVGHRFVGWYLGNSVYDFSTPLSGPITLVAKWENNIPAPEIHIDSTDEYYVHSLTIVNDEDYCYIYDCDEDEDDAYGITGYEIYEVDGDSYNLIDEMYDTDEYELYVRPNAVNRYAVRMFIRKNGDIAYSDYSNVVEVDTTWAVPQISFGMGDDHVVYGLLINNANDYCIGECDGSSTDKYMVDGIELYEKIGSNYSLISTYNSVESDYEFSANVNGASSNKIYVIRMFKNSNGKEYSEYSNELVLKPITPPNLSTTYISENRPSPLAYEGGHPETGFLLELNANHPSHIVCDEENPDDCYRVIRGYEIFEKNGELLTSIADEVLDDPVSVYIPAGSSKTFVAKAYVVDNGDHKVYSVESNEITIDLTNPVYTFDTIESQVDANKVNVRGYINNYEIVLHGIKIDNTLYLDDGTADTGEFVTIDSSIIENLDSIILGIEMPSQTIPNPDSFIVEVEATRR